MSDTTRPRRLVGVSTKLYFSFSRTLTYTQAILTHLSGDPTLFSNIDIFLIPDHQIGRAHV